MPETENRSLEDIELHFADNSKKLCDRKIAHSEQKQDKHDEFQCATSSRNAENCGFVKDGDISH